jgi:hypothetical protein
MIYIGEICMQKHPQYRVAILPSLLALATLVSATQIGSFLFRSQRPRWRQSKYKNVAVACRCRWHYHATFANVNTAVLGGSTNDRIIYIFVMTPKVLSCACAAGFANKFHQCKWYIIKNLTQSHWELEFLDVGRLFQAKPGWEGEGMQICNLPVNKT